MLSIIIAAALCAGELLAPSTGPETQARVGYVCVSPVEGKGEPWIERKIAKLKDGGEGVSVTKANGEIVEASKWGEVVNRLRRFYGWRFIVPRADFKSGIYDATHGAFDGSEIDRRAAFECKGCGYPNLYSFGRKLGLLIRWWRA